MSAKLIAGLSGKRSSIQSWCATRVKIRCELLSVSVCVCARASVSVFVSVCMRARQTCGEDLCASMG